MKVTPVSPGEVIERGRIDQWEVIRFNSEGEAIAAANSRFLGGECPIFNDSVNVPAIRWTPDPIPVIPSESTTLDVNIPSSLQWEEFFQQEEASLSGSFQMDAQAIVNFCPVLDELSIEFDPDTANPLRWLKELTAEIGIILKEVLLLYLTFSMIQMM